MADLLSLGDYFPGNNFTLAGDTTTSDLPSEYNIPIPDFVGTAAQAEIQAIPRGDPGVSVSGVLQSVTGTANSLLNIWSTGNQISSSIDNQRYQNQLNAAKLSLTSAQTLGAIDLAKTQADAAVAVGKAKTQMTLADEMAKVSSGGGNTAKPGISLTMVLCVFGLLYLASKNTKVKA